MEGQPDVMLERSMCGNSPNINTMVSAAGARLYPEQDAETDTVCQGNSLSLLFCKLMLEMKLESDTTTAALLPRCL